jgi:hypothetical protein
VCKELFSQPLQIVQVAIWKERMLSRRILEMETAVKNPFIYVGPDELSNIIAFIPWDYLEWDCTYPKLCKERMEFSDRILRVYMKQNSNNYKSLGGGEIIREGKLKATWKARRKYEKFYLVNDFTLFCKGDEYNFKTLYQFTTIGCTIGCSIGLSNNQWRMLFLSEEKPMVTFE